MENLKGLAGIKQDIMDLRGSEVTIFGQRQVLPSEVDELTIDILDIVEELKAYEVETIEVGQACEHCNGTGMVYTWNNEEGCELEEECSECDGVGIVYNDLKAENALNVIYDLGDLEELNRDNSYNWTAPVSNDFNFQVWKDLSNDKIYVEFKVHRYGDVRSNYTDTAVLEFSSDYGFLEALTEANKMIEVEGYDCEINILNEGIEVYTYNGEHVTDSYATSIEELKSDIAEATN